MLAALVFVSSYTLCSVHIEDVVLLVSSTLSWAFTLFLPVLCGDSLSS